MLRKKKKLKKIFNMIKALNEAYHLGPKAENAEYIVSIDDFKKGVIAVSAILNEHPSATLYFGVTDDGLVTFCLDPTYFEHENIYDTWEHWVKARGGNSLYSRGFLHSLKDYMIDEIQKAISPTVKVDFDIQKVGNWEEIGDLEEIYKDDPNYEPINDDAQGESEIKMGDIGVVRFLVTGGHPPYSAYGHYYMRKDGEICALDTSKYNLPVRRTQPVVSIGPKTKQAVYIETLDDLKEGLTSASEILYKYPYALIYVGVKQDGKVIEPRSCKKVLAGMPKTTLDYAFWIANQVLQALPQVTPGIEFCGNAAVFRFCISSSYEIALQKNKKNWATAPSDLYTGIWDGMSYTDIYELTSPIRNLTFDCIKELLEENGIAWENFESKFEVSLHNADGQYNLFAGLISDESDFCAEVSLIGDIWETSSINGALANGGFLFDRIDLALHCLYAFFDHQTEKNEFEKAYSYALMRHNWATLHAPIIETTNDSVDIIYFPNSFGKAIAKENEAFVRVMKLLEIIQGAPDSLDEICEKFGKQAVRYEPNGYCRISLPIKLLK